MKAKNHFPIHITNIDETSPATKRDASGIWRQSQTPSLSHSRISIRLVLALAALALNLSQAGSFTSTGSLSAARAAHVATLLSNGTVLVTGGYNGTDRLASSELYNPANGTWTATSSLSTGRTRHTATLLTNGLVLAAAGIYLPNVETPTCELYDPPSGTWTNTGSLVTARGGQTATLLLNGKVLITGGSPDADVSSLSSAELYDPATGTWTETSSMSTARDFDTATLLLNGKVLVAGGSADGYSQPALSSAELYDPSTGTWTATGSMTTVRENHTATLLTDGRVLVTGGDDFFTIYSSAELYDPASGTWTPTGALGHARRAHTVTLLPGGKMLAVGGQVQDASRLVTATSELYDPVSGTWTATASLSTARCIHTATLLPNGEVLVAGGFAFNPDTWFSSAELYHSSLGPVTLVGPSKLPSGAFQFAFTGAANGTNTVLATTNPALPLISWNILGVAPEFAPGLYTFSDTGAANNTRRFYRVRSP